MLIIAVPMLAVMYFLMIRPETKRRNEHQQLIGGLKRGDEVVLTSGIVGKIHAIEDKALVIEIADKVRIKVLKVALSGPAHRYLGGAEPPKSDDGAEKSTDKSTDKSSEKTSEKSSEKSADKSADKSNDKIREKPSEKKSA
jgi:preprotein translocase YajC subunit